MTGGVIEIIRPIFNNEDVLGYVYLRDSTQTLENLIAQLIMVTLSVLLIGLLMCFTLKLQTANCKLQSAISAPIMFWWNWCNVLRGKGIIQAEQRCTVLKN